MNNRIFKYTGILLLIFSLLASLGFKEADEEKKNSRLNKPTGQPVYKRFNVNRISTWIKNDGESDINPSGNSGLEYPKGSGKTAVFQSGFLWGGKVEGQIRVGGSVYRQGTVPGKILNSGVPIGELQAEDPGAANVRNYRVRPDFKTGSIAAEIADGEGSESEIRAEYERDWMEWPAADGAPFFDGDSNGVYEPDLDGDGVLGESGEDVPGVPGADQTIWFVCNDTDPDQTQFMYGSLPMGIEEQATIWGYNSAGPLGSMLFRKYKIINKSNTPITEMYVSMWNDPDLGDAADDFVGCDTVLSLAYCYNGAPADDIYDNFPAAVGFDFFQGPIISGVAGEDKNKNGIPDEQDFAIFNNDSVGPGFINLPMSAHYFYINQDPVYADPTQGQYQGTLQWYNFLQGRIGTTGEPFPDPTTGGTTKFTLYGDPVAGTGWLDGDLHPPGDRRAGMVAGPFTMEPGDTQEIVVAELIAGGTPPTNYLQAVSLLKDYDKIAQDAYNKFFILPSAPPAPNVTCIGLDKKIILNWGFDQERVQQTETHTNREGYSFQGYNIYQLPSPTGFEQAVRVATFDLVDEIKSIIGRVVDPVSGEVVTQVQQYGTDAGIQRYFEITKDYINNTELNNGSRYYFVVTAYSFNPDSILVPNNLENPFVALVCIPQSPDPGSRYALAYNDTVSGVEHSIGLSDGQVEVKVVDPSQLTGLSYKVVFDTLTVATSDTTSELRTVWHLMRSDSVRVLSNQMNQTGDESSPIIDGIQVKVFGAPNNFKDFLVVANGGGPLDPPEYGAFAFNSSGFPAPTHGECALAGDCPTDAQQLGDGYWGIHTGDDGSRAGYDAFLDRTTRGGDNWGEIVPFDFEIRFTGTSIAWKAFQDGSTMEVPFELWNIGSNTPDDPSDDYRMLPFVLDDDTNGVFNMGAPGTKETGTYDHSISGGDNDPYTDWIYFYKPLNTSPGTAGYDQYVTEVTAGGYEGENDVEAIARIVLINWNGDIGATPPSGEYNQDLPEQGTIFRMISTKPNVAGGDEFTFSIPANVRDNEIAKQDVEKINVFPNPYYGVNPQEINKYERFVTFNHLPNTATIRIFNLAGQLVRTIEKNAPGQFQRWDLTTDSGLPVASGLYVVYIDMPELGTTKILKAAIIQEEQILDRF